jgi:hypothetical protein
MNCPPRRLGKYLDKTSSPRTSGGRAVAVSRMAGLIGITTAAALLATAGVAHSGPCTAQIAALQQQISTTAPGPGSGPTFPQTLGAQLHEQPTPQDVEHAERVANKDGEAAIARARAADATGDAAGCHAALSEAKRLYDIDQ